MDVVRHAGKTKEHGAYQIFKTVNIILMALNKILLFSFFMIITSCNGQEKTNPTKYSNNSQPSPAVIKNFKAVALPPDFDTTLVSQYIRSIFQDSKGNLWFGTIANGVAKYDAKTLTYFSTPDGFDSGSTFAINEDKAGNLWFGTGEGVYKYDGKTFRHYNEKDGLRKLYEKDGLNHFDKGRTSVLVDKSGKVWVGIHGGVYQYDPSADSQGKQCFSLFSLLPPINVVGIMEGKNGNIWVASTDKGVFRYDGKTITNLNEKEGLGDNVAGGMAQDKNGNMWFTMKNGICKFDGKTFTEYTSKDGLGGTEFTGIFIEQSGIIWITGRGTTTRFDPSVPLSNPKAFSANTLQNPNAFTEYTSLNGLNCCVQSMYQDKAGNMWWGTGQGLYRFNGKNFYQVKQRGPWYHKQ